MLVRPALPQGIVRTREPCSTYRMDCLDGFIGTFSGPAVLAARPKPREDPGRGHCPRAGASMSIWGPRIDFLLGRRALRPRQQALSGRGRALGPAARCERSLPG